MKRICIIITAMALALIFTQCKKGNDTKPTTEGVKITLSVDDGSKVNVNPGTGTVTFQDGDVIYVGSGGNYVGSLTRTSGVFTGDITDPVEGEPLYFYFLGNVTPTIDGNLFTISIANQISALPVISCGTSTKNYSSTITSYSSKLMNKCALVKFNVTTSSSSATCINGFNNKLSINFSTNTTTPSKEGMGTISLASGNGEKWAVLLPQSAITTGSAYAQDGTYTGSYGAVPAIVENGYLTSGITVTVSTSNYVDLGLPSGTLWATYNVGAHVPEEYGDYFAWGETTPKATYNFSTYKYCKDGDSKQLTKYCTQSSYGYNGFKDNLTTLLPEDDAAIANWGGEWCMPMEDQWNELKSNTTSTWTTLNGVNGRLFTAANGNSLFLPAAGELISIGLYEEGNRGSYWSTLIVDFQPNNSWCGYFTQDNYYGGGNPAYRDHGFSVRAVRSPSSNQSFEINASANPSVGGSVTGTGSYNYGTTATLTATANTNYNFVNWTENGTQVSTSPSYSFSVTGDRNLVANFSIKSYNINASTNPSAGGSVTGTGTYNYGTTATLTATANTNYNFVNWTENGTQVSTNATYSFSVQANRTLVANFTVQATAPTGAINGKFSINANGDQVYFSQGNLQYIGSAATPYWKFAENQWVYLGNNGQGGSSQTVDRDLFGWGTSGYNHGANCYQPWNTSPSYSDYYAYGDYQYNLYDQTGQADWGCNPISNGGNQPNQWRTLSNDEWQYILFNRTTTSGICYARASVNNVNGVILLPDDWNYSYYTLNNTNDSGASYSSNVITASDWSTLELHGAVFLPAAGSRYNSMVANVGTNGIYWSSSYYDSNYAYRVFFRASNLGTQNGYRYYGTSVRLVCPVQ